ncbi:nucleotidyl transferase AbiEii/AbiGii toxin family protein [Flavobacterium macrobrachii]|uniref:Nucleotidyl transferase AbiEii/AbiGii toxin family protein n=1 Tax=Flavobacterium macrobrachii TaxID=591204 RepID=A0ABS2CTM2_9FLAO|nr:nucleotidyl transferase AbiEii/AbiGii toxin family protein [Flavobacterium macrobrachii]MBM6498323.1 nucleotidyl transferase AbiEii/AbiGii toxin family protein [Flavobacterium macrobrachii]
MINSETHTIDWIFNLKNKLGRRIDPKLIEKVVWALTLLEQLKINGLNFTFKGGTALLLATEKPKRFSIDIDIITEHSEKEIIAVLQKTVDEKIFLSWEDDNNRKHTPDAPIGHFKAYYKSVVDGNIEPILLDLLYTPNPYPENQEVKLMHPWLSTSEEESLINMPTFDAILGDKLTAFAPKTTGILYSKNRPVEIIKQLYDIAFLFDNITNLEIVRSSYSKVVKEEIGFRKLDITANEVLEDTWKACYTLAERDIKSEEFNHLQLGIRNFTNFTIDRFSIDEAITAAAKVAYLTKLIQSEKTIKIERFKNPLEIKDWIIEDQEYNKLNKLKKNNPEAFYYWYKASLFFEDVVIFSKEHKNSLKEAIRYFRAREGSFSGGDPLLKVIKKIDSEYSVSNNFTKEEIDLLLKVINENIEYMNKYEGYKSLSQEQAINLKQQILEPLYQLRKELMKI